MKNCFILFRYSIQVSFNLEMGDLSDFKSGQIVGVRMAGYCCRNCSFTWDLKRHVYVGIGEIYLNSSANHKSGRSSSLAEMKRRALNRIVRVMGRKIIPSKIIAELNEHLETIFD